MSKDSDSLIRFAEHLVSEVLTPGIGLCEVSADPEDRKKSHAASHPGDRGRCPYKSVAIRWEDGYADRVCEKHAENARTRGAIVVAPLRHDGIIPRLVGATR